MEGRQPANAVGKGKNAERWRRYSRSRGALAPIYDRAKRHSNAQELRRCRATDAPKARLQQAPSAQTVIQRSSRAVRIPPAAISREVRKPSEVKSLLVIWGSIFMHPHLALGMPTAGNEQKRNSLIFARKAPTESPLRRESRSRGGSNPGGGACRARRSVDSLCATPP